MNVNHAIEACEAALKHSMSAALADYLWDEFVSGKDISFEQKNVSRLYWKTTIRTDESTWAGKQTNGVVALCEEEYVVLSWKVDGKEVCRYEGAEIPLREPSTVRPSMQIDLLPNSNFAFSKGIKEFFGDDAFRLCFKRGIDPDTLEKA